MPLNGSTLKGMTKPAILTKLEELFGADVATLRSADQTAIASSWEKLADAISEESVPTVTHIKADAVVNVSNVGGVTPGSGTSGPGTGTIA